MDKTDKNTIEELLPRYCEGLATEEERLQVEMWMDESEENRRMAKQIHALYLATDTVHIMTKVDTTHQGCHRHIAGKLSGSFCDA